MTKIMKCYCKNEWQDKQYGKQRRVFNSTKQGTTDKIVWRCTVCGKNSE